MFWSLIRENSSVFSLQCGHNIWLIFIRFISLRCPHSSCHFKTLDLNPYHCILQVMKWHQAISRCLWSILCSRCIICWRKSLRGLKWEPLRQLNLVLWTFKSAFFSRLATSWPEWLTLCTAFRTLTSYWLSQLSLWFQELKVWHSLKSYHLDPSKESNRWLFAEEVSNGLV